MANQSDETGSILAVDDQEVNLVLIEEVLADFELTTSLTGEDAIRQVRSAPPDLILLDLMMPGLSGQDVCRILKEDPKTARIPIVFLTAVTNAEEEVGALRMGAADYVTKPFKPEILLARVRKELRLVRLAREAERNARMAGTLATAVTMSHEINNPLQGIVAELESLRRGALDEPGRASVEDIEQLVQRIRGVISRMARLVEPVYARYSDGIPMVDFENSAVKGGTDDGERK